MYEFYLQRGVLEYLHVVTHLDVIHRLTAISSYLALHLFFLLLFGLILVNRFDSVKKLRVQYFPAIRTYGLSVVLSLFNYTFLLFPYILLFIWFVRALQPPLEVYIVLVTYLLFFGLSIASWHSTSLTLTTSISVLLIPLLTSVVIAIPWNLLMVLLVYACLPALIKIFSTIFMKIPKIVVIGRLGYAPLSPYILAITAFLFTIIGFAKLVVGERVVLSINMMGVVISIRDFSINVETVLALIATSLFTSLVIYAIPPLLNLANRYVDSHLYYIKLLTGTKLVTRVLNVLSAFTFGWCYAMIIYGILHALNLIEFKSVPMFTLTTGLLAGVFTLNRVERDFEFTKCFVFYLVTGVVLQQLVNNTLIQDHLGIVALTYTVLVLMMSILLYDLPVKVACFIRFRVIPWLRR